MGWSILLVAALGIAVIAFAAGFAWWRAYRKHAAPKPKVRSGPRWAQHRRNQDRELTLSASLLGRVAASYLAILIAVAGAGLLGYQAAAWLATGDWPPYSVIDGLRGFTGGPAWLDSPGSWTVFHSWLANTPMGAVLLVGSVVCLVVLLQDDK